MKAKLTITCICILIVCFLVACGIKKHSKVYVCTGKYATKYHYQKECGMLGNCKGRIKSVTLDDAVAMGRTLCRECEKND